MIDDAYVGACEERRKRVERVMAVLFTATKGPDQAFMEALDAYIFGKLTLEEMSARVDHLEYLGV